jgi:hypothetical protein
MKIIRNIINFFRSYNSELKKLRKEKMVYMEYHHRVHWSPWPTTRLYPSGRIEPVYGGTLYDRSYDLSQDRKSDSDDDDKLYEED